MTVTTSGTVGQTVIDVADLVAHAYRRCKLAPSTISNEFAQAALRLLFLLSGTWANRGLLLWTIEKSVLGYVQGRAGIALPDGTVDVLSALHRTLQRATGVEASDSGGVAGHAFDGSLESVLTQAAPNGSVSLDMQVDGLITTVGVVSGATATYALVFEVSADGLTWTAVKTLPVQEYPDLVPVWLDVEEPRYGRFCRVREVGGATLALRELVFGSQPSEIPIYRGNRDEYFSLPNKTLQSRVVTQFWCDREAAAPVLRVWPTPSFWLDSIVVWRSRMIQDPGGYTDAQGNQLKLEVPARWYEAVISGLAMMIGMEHPDVPAQHVKFLSDYHDKQLAMAESNERDNSPIRLVPRIRSYTR
jgi:hypothetical protein